MEQHYKLKFYRHIVVKILNSRIKQNFSNYNDFLPKINKFGLYWLHDGFIDNNNINTVKSGD